MCGNAWYIRCRIARVANSVNYFTKSSPRLTARAWRRYGLWRLINSQVTQGQLTPSKPSAVDGACSSKLRIHRRDKPFNSHAVSKSCAIQAYRPLMEYPSGRSDEIQKENLS